MIRVWLIACVALVSVYASPLLAQEAASPDAVDPATPTFPDVFDGSILELRYLASFHLKNNLAQPRGSLSHWVGFSYGHDFVKPTDAVGFGFEAGVGFYYQSTFYRYAQLIQEFINTDTRFNRAFLTAHAGGSLILPVTTHVQIRFGAALHFGWMFDAFVWRAEESKPGTPRVGEDNPDRFAFNFWPAITAGSRIFLDPNRQFFVSALVELRFAIRPETDFGTGFTISETSSPIIYGLSIATGMNL